MENLKTDPKKFPEMSTSFINSEFDHKIIGISSVHPIQFNPVLPALRLCATVLKNMDKNMWKKIWKKIDQLNCANI